MFFDDDEFEYCDDIGTLVEESNISKILHMLNINIDRYNTSGNNIRKFDMSSSEKVYAHVTISPNDKTIYIPISFMKLMNGIVTYITCDNIEEIEDTENSKSAEEQYTPFKLVIWGDETDFSNRLNSQITKDFISQIQALKFENIDLDRVYIYGNFEDINTISECDKKLSEIFNIPRKNILIYASSIINSPGAIAQPKYKHMLSTYLQNKTILFDDLNCSICFSIFPTYIKAPLNTENKND